MKTCKSYARDGKGNNERTADLEKNLDSLLRRNAGRAYKFARSLARSADEAEELIQRASYQVLRNWERYDPLQSFQGWYLTMVKRLFLDIRRSSAYRTTVPVSMKLDKVEDLDLSDVLADSEPGPLEQLERKEEADAARQALEALSEEQQAVLTLCDIEQMSYDAAARQLGLPAGTLRSRLFRARAALRRKVTLV
jgi:RNA polymerase sigma-70 factor (ECF subfamily)